MANLGSRRNIHKHTDSPFLELPDLSAHYQVITNGLWKEESFFKDKPGTWISMGEFKGLPYVPPSIEQIEEVITEVFFDRGTSERAYRFTTNSAGYDQFEQAVRDQLSSMLDEASVELDTSTQSVLPGEVFIGSTSGGVYTAGFDPYIENTDSITITRQFTTTEEAINYLDQLSNNDI